MEVADLLRTHCGRDALLLLNDDVGHPVLPQVGEVDHRLHRVGDVVYPYLPAFAVRLCDVVAELLIEGFSAFNPRVGARTYAVERAAVVSRAVCIGAHSLTLSPNEGKLRGLKQTNLTTRGAVTSLAA